MLDLNLLKTMVRKIAKERPDVKYGMPESGTCSYDEGVCSDGSVGCIFGQAAKLLGEPLYGSREITDYYDDDWCLLVQTYQDKGRSWGEAVRQADMEISV